MSSSDEAVTDISVTHLQEEIESIINKLNIIISNNKYFKKRIDELTDENYNLYDYLNNVEIQVNNLDQYSRRNNVEIKNIPEKISQRNLEGYVLKVMAAINIKITSYDLVAVHRIGRFISGSNRNVITRFVNKKMHTIV